MWESPAWPGGRALGALERWLGQPTRLRACEFAELNSQGVPGPAYQARRSRRQTPRFRSSCCCLSAQASSAPCSSASRLRGGGTATAQQPAGPRPPVPPAPARGPHRREHSAGSMEAGTAPRVRCTLAPPPGTAPSGIEARPPGQATQSEAALTAPPPKGSCGRRPPEQAWPAGKQGWMLGRGLQRHGACSGGGPSLSAAERLLGHSGEQEHHWKRKQQGPGKLDKLMDNSVRPQGSQEGSRGVGPCQGEGQEGVSGDPCL